MIWEVYTSAGHVLARIGNYEDADDFREMMDRKLRAQGFKRPPYPSTLRLVNMRVIHPA
jgi:hypothetical protein